MPALTLMCITSQLEQVLHPAQPIILCYVTVAWCQAAEQIGVIGVNNLGRYPVTVQADGEYTCVPLNTVGIGDNATFAVIAVDAPLVDVFPAITSVQEGNNITLSCNASGKPGPVIAWTKVGSSQVLSHTSLLSVVNAADLGQQTT